MSPNPPAPNDRPRDRFDSERTRWRTKPAAGVAANRASAWCGRAECGRYVLAADSEPELDSVLAEWRCPRCEGPAQ